jgi:hypothetical protein
LIVSTGKVCHAPESVSFGKVRISI